jgi:hypothetical protein
VVLDAANICSDRTFDLVEYAMIEKFEIEISSFDIVGGIHYYGRVELPMSRQKSGDHRTIELERPAPKDAPSWWTSEDGTWMTIRFDTIQQVIDAAKEWFLENERVKPGDKLVIWKGYWEKRNERL